jgi:uncharacterized phage protein gp47/JayE
MSSQGEFSIRSKHISGHDISSHCCTLYRRGANRRYRRNQAAPTTGCRERREKPEEEVQVDEILQVTKDKEMPPEDSKLSES